MRLESRFPICPDCGEDSRNEESRRDFLKTAVAGGIGVAVGAAVPEALTSALAESTRKSSESLVSVLYSLLTAEQRRTVAFPFDHLLRSRVENNWQITPVKIKEFFTPEQQAIIKDIFVGVHNPEYVDKVLHHIKEDGGGIENYSIAIFGEPGTGKFEFVLTGRHCTMRCDGDSVDGAAFGGPIFYGHASGGFNEKPDHPGNVYWYQAKRANQLFQALDGKQKEQALLADSRQEQGTETVALKSGRPAGLPVSEMSRDQRELLEKVLADLLLPFRRQDSEEAMRYIKKNGSFEKLTMSFYKNMDIGNDGVWDVWQLESPSMIWYFRGSPHVHVWVNIRA